MSIQFLGAGGAFSRRYGTTCSLLTLASGELWLVDCGRQAPDQVHAAGLNWHAIDGQLVTHSHGDHIYGLEDFAFSRYFYAAPGGTAVRDGGPRPKLVCHSAVRDEVWQVLRPSLRYLPDPANPIGGTLATYFDAIEASASEPARTNPWPHAERFTTDGLSVLFRETLHVPGKPSTSIEISLGAGDRVAWWSGDSTVDPAHLTAIEPRTSVFFHDCTFVEYPGQVHGSFSRLEQLPEPVRRKMVLMHHEDDLEEHRARAEALGFRVALPGDRYDLAAGRKI
jgi:ribonuclease BN (tRNA processing enzyme)